MKTNYILKTLIFLLFVVTATAQQGINYKAMIKDVNGDAIANTSVIVQFTILENGTTAVYSESHNPTTDANGIIIVNIGEGTPISGDFNTIAWGSNPHFLKTEIDSGDGLTDMGTTEFKTVPYAIHAINAANENYIDNKIDTLNEIIDAITTGFTFCDSLFVDLKTDELHCGDCETKCPEGYECEDGQCVEPDDDDGDGFTEQEGDCDDDNIDIFPGAPEPCGTGIDANCDGFLTECFPEDVIYVSDYEGIDVNNCGSFESPCKTISQGIQVSTNTGRSKVFVAAGVYDEAVFIVPGINLYGGYIYYSTYTNVWEAVSKSIIKNTQSPALPTVSAIGINQPTTIKGFEIHGPVNDSPSGNSYAIYIKSSGGIVLENNEIMGGIAGNGMEGAQGNDGLDGIDGQNGSDTRTLTNPSDENFGGSGGIRTIDGVSLSGGNGGRSVAPNANDYDSAANGEDGRGPAILDGGAGGAGGHDRYFLDGLIYIGEYPIIGQNGENGLKGENGQVVLAPGDATGTVINDHWRIDPSTDGFKGGDGSGGGGGGAAGGIDDRSSANTDVLGASGGGGGSGAEGGHGGAGAEAGGGSFCVFIINSEAPVIDNCRFYLGRSGRGGNGGNGGIGGDGGFGSFGGAILEEIPFSYGLGRGGNAGIGGNGGHGGGGAGGTGGSTFGIYSHNMSGNGNFETSNQFHGGIAGNGGSGGLSLGNNGHEGVNGIVENIIHN